MSRRLHALFVAVLFFAGFISSAHAQFANPASRFATSPVTGELRPVVSPGQQRPMTVVLKMAGDPVAVVRSRMPGKRMAESDKKAIEGSLRAQQQALRSSIEGQGATVLAEFQDAINGIKVRGTPDQIAALALLPGVIAVKPVMIHKLVNVRSVPFIGAPGVWQGPPGLHGEHIKIAILDTGIDYTHANFGGPGTVAAFKAAFAASTAPADPALFGPNAPKVKGGTDFVGDNYDASSNDPAKNTPVPDPNPLDCNGHGSHVAGTAAGFGITASGSTFKGPYDANTPKVAFRVGPGVAPLATLGKG
jgi:minor extracellular serine protease Vpr